ncbi:putative transposase fragment (plasmid) [Cupriavidus taiwanensis LMG 19424]|uniref:Transposase n=3 Tax=Cupriavidus TaxID=106589 RepID=B2AJ25_CUPTR|nr:putative transposase fragment [Cupriavidus taiwanensis LMG 19424]SPC24024.1 transposase [Cupriavidus taiwanensis]SPD62429.1 transposase [Cupriavidus neocaledonicus]SPD37508.1 transposase [Cupriavidus taiwanensis]SPD61728.1 transposase [Cupriavidus taiwanensis]
MLQRRLKDVVVALAYKIAEKLYWPMGANGLSWGRRPPSPALNRPLKYLQRTSARRLAEALL